MEEKQHGNTGNKNASKDQGATSTLHGRCTPQDKARWVKQAQKEGKKLMPWVVDVLNGQCDRS